jgi:hypothetical protein
MELLSKWIGDQNVSKLQESKFVIITSDELQHLQEGAKKIKEHDTYLSGMIRLFEIQNDSEHLLIIQETSLRRKEIIIRCVRSIESYEKFIELRKSQFDDLWEAGCCGGARLIDYEKPFEE